jgi:hypothetical protein
MIMKMERTMTRAGDLAGIHAVLRRSGVAALFLSAAFLAACGSSGGDGGSSTNTSASAAMSISGTVSTGLSAANLAVTAYEPDGTSCGSATSAADGTFTLKGTCTAPYLLAAQTPQGLLVTQVLGGQASGSITPITTAIFEMATGNTEVGASATTIAALLPSLTSAQVNAATTSVVGALATLFPGFDGWSGFDPYAMFTADHTGIDGVIGQFGLQQTSVVSVTVTNTATSQSITITANAGGAPTVGTVTSPSASSGSGSTGDGSSGDGSTGTGSSGGTGTGTGSSSTSGTSTGTAPVLHCAP